jgi:hypothetical protein
VYLTFVKAVILILKHATCLHGQGSNRLSALALADLDYCKANIDLNIQQYLKAYSEHSVKHSVEEFAHFIMATEIGVLILHLWL